MTIDQWLMIALIISTLIGPFAPAIVDGFSSPRKNQPTTIPDTSQPKHKAKRIALAIAWFVSAPWIMPPILLALSINGLLRDMRGDPIVTAQFVLKICIDVAFSVVAVALSSLPLRAD